MTFEKRTRVNVSNPNSVIRYFFSKITVRLESVKQRKNKIYLKLRCNLKNCNFFFSLVERQGEQARVGKLLLVFEQ